MSGIRTVKKVISWVIFFTVLLICLVLGVFTWWLTQMDNLAINKPAQKEEWVKEIKDRCPLCVLIRKKIKDS